MIPLMMVPLEPTGIIVVRRKNNKNACQTQRTGEQWMAVYQAKALHLLRVVVVTPCFHSETPRFS